jgi:hypothetical protein
MWKVEIPQQASETMRSGITDEWFMEIKELYSELSRLNMSVYSPFEYLLPWKILYDKLYDTNVTENSRLKQSTREKAFRTYEDNASQTARKLYWFF